MYEFKDMIFKVFECDFRLVIKNKGFCLFCWSGMIFNLVESPENERVSEG